MMLARPPLQFVREWLRISFSQRHNIGTAKIDFCFWAGRQPHRAQCACLFKQNSLVITDAKYRADIFARKEQLLSTRKRDQR